MADRAVPATRMARVSSSEPEHTVRRSRSSLARRFGAEARRETVRALTTLQRIGGGSGQDAEPDELRMELVADVDRLHGCVFEVQPDLHDGVAGPAAHASRGVPVVGVLVPRAASQASCAAGADNRGAGARRPM
jgi:hypothetical protein